MSVTYWFARKFGVLIVVLYAAAIGVLLVSQYHAAGVASQSALAQLYPAGAAYPRTMKNKIVRDIFGMPEPDDATRSERDTVEILAYTDKGADIRLKGKTQQGVPPDKVIHYLVNRDSSQVEGYLAPLATPLRALLDIHIRFMKRVEERVASADPTGLTARILPKAVISVVYLGLVFVIMYVLRRVDRASEYKAGYSLTYGAFVYWPLAVIVISFAGSNVVDVVRHFPDSKLFMHWYVVLAWAVMLAWPLLVAALSAVDVIRAALRLDYNHALGHAAVLGVGLVAIPLVAVGVLFAVLAVAMYVGYRVAKRTILPGGKSDGKAAWLGKLLGR